MNFFDILINNGQICMGFEPDELEKVQKLAYFYDFLKKNLIKEVIDEQRVKKLFNQRFLSENLVSHASLPCNIQHFQSGSV